MTSRPILLIVAFLLFSALSSLSQNSKKQNLLIPQFNPKHYVCQRTNTNIQVDGLLNEEAWQNALWSDDFVDIEGSKKPLPMYKTRIKMLWDDKYLYIAAEMEEPHIWAKLTQRDAVIYHDNDFEVFIDPDGDTHFYCEYEVNAFNTVWDLLLGKPYRDGGPAINNWDINGLKSAVHIDGTINDPSDKDNRWFIEVAFPLDVLHECCNGHYAESGQIWRINFSRVQWQTETKTGTYEKAVNSETQKVYAENNWVWSPQGVVAMHQPETWGFLIFSDKASGEFETPFEIPQYEKIKWELRQIYYAQKVLYQLNKSYTPELKTLYAIGLPESRYTFSLHITPTMFEVKHINKESGTIWHINHEGRTWKSKVD